MKRKPLPALWLLALATLSPPTAAQWQATGGPLGGLGYDVRIHPTSKSRMFVTDNYAGVILSTDGGATWRASNSGISVRGGVTGDAYPIFSLTLDPNNPDIVWAGTNGEGGQFGIFKSSDGGASWTLKSGGLTPDPFGIVFRGFTIEPGNSNVVYAMAEVPSDRQGREFNRTHGRVYKSADGGGSWSMLWQGDNLARYLLIDPSDSKTLYLSTGIFDREAYNSDCAAGQSGGVGVLKSVDGGVTWAAINQGLADLYVGTLRMQPGNPKLLFAGTGNNACSGMYENNLRSGLFRSADGGASWSKVIGNDIMTTVNFAPANPNVVYAGSAAAFYRSSDAGLSWSRYNKPGNAAWGPQGVRAGVPIDAVVDASDANLLYANNYGGGVFRSSDGAKSWSIWSKGYSGATVLALALTPSSPSTVLAIGRSGPYQSANYGGDWRGIGNGAAQFAEWYAGAVSPSDPQVIVLADEHQGKLMRSSDGGANFSIVFTQPNANAANIATRQGFKALLFAPSDAQVVYAGLALARGAADQAAPAGPVLYVSHNGGRSFAAGGSELDSKSVHRLVVHPSRADTVWAATSSGLYRSSDSGAHWALLGLAGKNVTAVAVDSANDLLIAGVKDVGIWIGTAGGSSWRGPSNAGLNNANPYPTELLVGSAGELFLADKYSGVYRSSDQGQSWSPFPDSHMSGLGFRSIWAMQRGADGLLYTATEGGGVYRYGAPSASPASAAFTGNASGSLAGRRLTVSIEPAAADLGASRQLFVAALFAGQAYFLTASGWQVWSGGGFPPYASGPLARQTLVVLDASFDLSAIAGAEFYVGYGISADEMVATGRLARVHVLR